MAFLSAKGLTGEANFDTKKVEILRPYVNYMILTHVE